MRKHWKSWLALCLCLAMLSGGIGIEASQQIIGDEAFSFYFSSSEGSGVKKRWGFYDDLDGEMYPYYLQIANDGYGYVDGTSVGMNYSDIRLYLGFQFVPGNTVVQASGIFYASLSPVYPAYYAVASGQTGGFWLYGYGNYSESAFSGVWNPA